MSNTKFFTDGKKRKHSVAGLGAELIQGLAQESLKFSADCGRIAFKGAGMPVADKRRVFQQGGKTIVLIERK